MYVYIGTARCPIAGDGLGQMDQKVVDVER